MVCGPAGTRAVAAPRMGTCPRPPGPALRSRPVENYTSRAPPAVPDTRGRTPSPGPSQWPSAPLPPTRGDARTRTGHVGKGSRSEQGRTGEGQGAPDGEHDGEHAGRGARATAVPPARTMRARRTAGTNEKARNRWVSAGSGPALAVRGGGLEPP